jgi:hypothetical protein
MPSFFPDPLLGNDVADFLVSAIASFGRCLGRQIYSAFPVSVKRNVWRRLEAATVDFCRSKSASAGRWERAGDRAILQRFRSTCTFERSCKQSDAHELNLLNASLATAVGVLSATTPQTTYDWIVLAGDDFFNMTEVQASELLIACKQWTHFGVLLWAGKTGGRPFDESVCLPQHTVCLCRRSVDHNWSLCACLPLEAVDPDWHIDRFRFQIPVHPHVVVADCMDRRHHVWRRRVSRSHALAAAEQSARSRHCNQRHQWQGTTSRCNSANMGSIRVMVASCDCGDLCCCRADSSARVRSDDTRRCHDYRGCRRVQQIVVCIATEIARCASAYNQTRARGIVVFQMR